MSLPSPLPSAWKLSLGPYAPSQSTPTPSQTETPFPTPLNFFLLVASSSLSNSLHLLPAFTHSRHTQSNTRTIPQQTRLATAILAPSLLRRLLLRPGLMQLMAREREIRLERVLWGKSKSSSLTSSLSRALIGAHPFGPERER